MSNKDLLDFSGLNKLEPKKGRLLISEPFIDDDYFKRSVILLCEHDEEGSFGFVLNNFLDQNLFDLTKEGNHYTGKISLGGPVQTNNLFYIHTLGNKIENAREIVKGLFIGGDFDELKKLIENGDANESNIRFFLGYSGWSENQLNEEIKRKSWFVAKASFESIMHTADDLWQETLKKMGGKFSMISNFPENPALN
ncbi:MAG: YqgE/AlgH family protein [Flavobacteriales bacterium]